MAHSLTAGEEEQYAAIIDEILEASDLETISRKAIMQGLAAKVGKDLHDYKAAIKQLIIDRFDAHSAAQSAKRTASEQATDDLEDAEAAEESEEPRPKKKRKRDTSTEDEDAKLAAQLQAQENQRARTRTTRTSGTRAAAPKKKAPAKKKSAKKVRPEDDSDVEDGSDEAPKKKKGGGGFQKPFNLSDALFDVCGEKQLSRPQVVKKLWEYIKANELQDPKDRKQILCDEKLQAVFSSEKTNAFSMNKFLGKHLYPIDE